METTSALNFVTQGDMGRRATASEIRSRAVDRRRHEKHAAAAAAAATAAAERGSASGEKRPELAAVNVAASERKRVRIDQPKAQREKENKGLPKRSDNEKNGRNIQELASINSIAQPSPLCGGKTSADVVLSCLKIGAWKIHSHTRGELVAKFYYAKRKIVWEVNLDEDRKQIEIKWCDIIALKATMEKGEPNVLEIEISKSPSFFQEISADRKRHKYWKSTEDFTNGQATTYRIHSFQCPPGKLERQYMNLLLCDNRLLYLSQKSFPHLGSQYLTYPKNLGIHRPHLSSRIELNSNFSNPANKFTQTGLGSPIPFYNSAPASELIPQPRQYFQNSSVYASPLQATQPTQECFPNITQPLQYFQNTNSAPALELTQPIQFHNTSSISPMPEVTQSLLVPNINPALAPPPHGQQSQAPPLMTNAQANGASSSSGYRPNALQSQESFKGKGVAQAETIPMTSSTGLVLHSDDEDELACRRLEKHLLNDVPMPRDPDREMVVENINELSDFFNLDMNMFQKKDRRVVEKEKNEEESEAAPASGMVEYSHDESVFLPCSDISDDSFFSFYGVDLNPSLMSF